jgi:hypothetical protein
MSDVIAEQHFTRAEELLAAISATDGRWTRDLRDWAFRGHVSDQWLLIPSCLRRDEETKLPVWPVLER